MYLILIIAALSMLSYIPRRTTPIEQPHEVGIDPALEALRIKLESLRIKLQLKTQDLGTIDARLLSVILIAVGILQFSHDDRSLTNMPAVLLAIAIGSLLFHLGFMARPAKLEEKPSVIAPPAAPLSTTALLEQLISETQADIDIATRRQRSRSRWTAFAAIITLVAAIFVGISHAAREFEGHRGATGSPTASLSPSRTGTTRGTPGSTKTATPRIVNSARPGV